jgi:regulator of replication initiation timing
MIMIDADGDDIEAITAQACETSTVVGDLFEEQNPSAAAAFNDFYALAIRALDLQQAQLSEMQSTRDDFLDQVSLKLLKMGTMKEEVTKLEDQVQATIRNIGFLRDEKESLIERNRILAIRLSRYATLNDELAAIGRSCDDIEPQLPHIRDQIAAEKARQAQLRAEIERVNRLLSEGDPTTRQKLKKNQMKVLELEAKIKKTGSVPSVIDLLEPEIKPAGPSMIIHRTQDSEADEVRTLRTAMEEAIKQNAAIRTQITGLDSDLTAMHQENEALKKVLRSILETKE